MPFRRAVDDPNLGASAPQIVAHLLEAGAVKKTGDSNETDDAFFVLVGQTRRSVISGTEHFPGCPAPEIDIEVL